MVRTIDPSRRQWCSPAVERRHLTRIAKLKARVDAANETLRAATVEAFDAGVPRTKLAAAHGMSRQAFYKILNREAPK